MRGYRKERFHPPCLLGEYALQRIRRVSGGSSLMTNDKERMRKGNKR